VITGASSGIGAALAHEFAAHGHELVLIVRREQALVGVADAIAAKGGARPTVLRLDVARIDGTYRARFGAAVTPDALVYATGGAARCLDFPRFRTEIGAPGRTTAKSTRFAPMLRSRQRER
jgi:short-subunit dehydrogenase